MPPLRSRKQRLEALQRANQVRSLRAQDKRLVSGRELDARKIVLSPPDYWEGARVAELLLAVPALGHTKLRRMLESRSVSPSRTLGGLTGAQRARLAEDLSRYYRR